MSKGAIPAQGPVDVNVSRLESENKRLRHLLFMAHGSEEHYLYGDDGERTCNTCMIDFNRDPADEIERKIYEYNMLKLARLHPEWVKPAN